MTLGVAYSYCVNLTEEEKFEIDKRVEIDQFELKVAIFFPFLTFPVSPEVPLNLLNSPQIIRNARDRSESVGTEKMAPLNQQISEGSKSALLIRNGDLSKTGPGARAKADASRYFKTKGLGSTLLPGTDALGLVPYTHHHIYCDHYHKNDNIPSCRKAHKNSCPPDDQGKYLKMDQDGYCLGKRNKKFVRVEHQHKQAKFQTPENPNDSVQEASEVTETETITLTTDIKKRQVHTKAKHKGLFENPDGSSIDTYPEFKDSQVRFLKDKSDSKYVSDCILIGDGSEPKDAACVIDDKTQHCLVLKKTQRWNSETKSMEESPILDYVGPRKLSINQYEKFKRYGIIGFDGKDISQAKHGMRAKELMKIRSNQIHPFGDSDTCSVNEE